MITEPQSPRGKFNQTWIIAGVVVAGVIVVFMAIRLGYTVDWTGFNKHIETVPQGQQDQPAKTLWDWLQLLIVPAVLAVGAFLFNLATTRTEQNIAAQRYQDDQRIALDKQREDLLQAYLDRMSELLLKEGLRTSQQDSEVRNVARVRTVTVLSQLDTRRKNVVLSFLHESQLVTSETNKSIVTFSRADLNEADLENVNFGAVDLSEAYLKGANLKGANLSGANLSEANLNGADLRGTCLLEAHLNKTGLKGADLSKACLIGADLSEADLNGADLRGAVLLGTDFRGAHLRGANLIGSNFFGTNLRGAHLDKAKISPHAVQHLSLAEDQVRELELI